MEPAEETYTKTFVKEFGLIDPDQDWNMATRGSVTVTTASATEVKVYAKTDEDNYRLVGDFGGVSGTQTLEFDVPRGTTDILVEAKGSSKKASVDSNVDFANKSRTTHLQDGTSTDNITVEVATDKNGNTLYDTFTENSSTDETGVYEYRATLPEDYYNLNKVSQNFSFASGDDELSFLLYPIYWQTNGTDEIGIAYQKDNEIKHVPVYTIKSGNELCGSMTWAFYNTYHLSAGTDNVTVNDANSSTTSHIYLKDNEDYTDYPIDLDIDPNNYTDEQKESVKNWVIKRLNLPSNVTFADSWGSNNNVLIFQTGSVYVGYSGDVWKPIDNQISTQRDNNYTYEKFRSQGIKVTIPANTSFCFYINDGSFYMYSALNLNDDDHVHAATFMNSLQQRCIAFEDWHNGPLSPNNPNSTNSGGGDLNDVVLYTTLATSGDDGGGELINEDATSWILAAEDLGNIDDFDFNDMVIKVTTPVVNSASTSDDDKYKVEVTALAAGGTLPLKLKWKNPSTSDVKTLASPINESEQFHSWFGDGNIATGTMINTYSATSYATSTKTIYMSETEKEAFTLSSTSVNNKDVPGKMGGFSFIVDRNGDGTFTEATEIKAPKNGTAPQMICVPDTWLWPTERTRISTAYDGFEQWGGGYGGNEWYKNPENGTVVTR